MMNAMAVGGNSKRLVEEIHQSIPVPDYKIGYVEFVVYVLVVKIISICHVHILIHTSTALFSLSFPHKYLPDGLLVSKGRTSIK